jgi:hypothetical protein
MGKVRQKPSYRSQKYTVTWKTRRQKKRKKKAVKQQKHRRNNVVVGAE